MNTLRYPRWYVVVALSGAVYGCGGHVPPPWNHHHPTADRIGVPTESPRSADESMPASSSLSADEYEHLADHSVAAGNLTVAMAQYGKALRLDPARARVREKRGILFLKKRLAEDALLEFTAMADENPTSAAALDGEGRSLASLGRWEEAEQAFRRAIVLNPQDWRAYAWLGIVAYAHERYPDALAAFHTACFLKPEHPGLLNNLGQTYVALGRYEDAIASFRLGDAHAPDHPRLTRNLAGALALAGQLDAAEQVRRVRGPGASASIQKNRNTETSR
ncbi:MAG: tetratricopeptide repeat protein [Nitrospira sp. CR2.1]|nr:tetratricopeptide repeat protein [Nitrospira sp. CR2.1]